MIDRIFGGPGLHRGRRHPVDLRVGDGLDFWRVVALEPPRRMLLLAEMKSPGDELLEFKVSQEDNRRVALEILTRFLPRGVAGIAYWYTMLLAHQWIFEGILMSIARRTEKLVLDGPNKISVDGPLECRL